MATIKSYTDISQSKKLSEILPLESADMFYDGVQDLYKEKVYNIPIDGSSITVRNGHTITEKGIKANLLLPAWSLAALFGILTENKICHYNDRYYCQYINEGGEFPIYSTAEYGNPVDACVAMIEHLHELKML